MPTQGVFSIDDVLAAVPGATVLGASKPREPIAGLASNPKHVQPGGAFAAVRGGGPWYGDHGGPDCFDYHPAIPRAVALGASVILSEIPAPIAGATVIVVPNVIESLGALAAYLLAGSKVRVIGVTGSTGKSTACEVTATVLRSEAPAFKPLLDRSTPISLPLQIINARLDMLKRAVFEMPMDGPGQIAELCRIAPPDVAVVVNINTSHIEQLGSLEAIQRAKGEIIQALRPGGTAVLNADDSRVEALQNLVCDGGRVLSYGLNLPADVSATDIALSTRGSIFTVSHDGRSARAALPMFGSGAVSTALAAVCVGLAEGLTLDATVGALAGFEPLPGRLHLLEGTDEFLVLDDTRLCTPESFAELLRTVRGVPKRERRVLIQGPVLRSYEHGEVSPLVWDTVSRSFDLVILVGAGLRGAATYLRQQGVGADRLVHLEDATQAPATCQGLVRPNDLVVVNASQDANFGPLIVRPLVPAHQHHLVVDRIGG